VDEDTQKPEGEKEDDQIPVALTLETADKEAKGLLNQLAELNDDNLSVMKSATLNPVSYLYQDRHNERITEPDVCEQQDF